jgi:hypothetical protein
VWRQNGFERALKSGVRSLLFDGRDLRVLRAALEHRGYSMRIDTALNVGDAAANDYGERRIDFVLLRGCVRAHFARRSQGYYDAFGAKALA